MALYSDGLCSYGLCRYGLLRVVYSHGLYSYGSSYGPYGYGLYNDLQLAAHKPQQRRLARAIGPSEREPGPSL